MQLCQHGPESQEEISFGIHAMKNYGCFESAQYTVPNNLLSECEWTFTQNILWQVIPDNLKTF